MSQKKKTAGFVAAGIALVLWIIVSSALLGLSYDIQSAALGFPSIASLIISVIGAVFYFAALLVDISDKK